MTKHFRVTRVLFAVLALSLFYFSCKKDSGSKPVSFSDFEYAGELNGSVNNNGVTSTDQGYITIDSKGATTIEFRSGSMKGAAVKTGDTYTFTISEVAGVFADVTGIAGSVETTSGAALITGTNYGGSSLAIMAQVTPVATSDPGWDQLAKASVLFTHNETMLASVTINGVTLSGLNAHYHQGGLCDGYYALGNSIPQNVDAAESEILCHSGVLKGLDGQPKPFTDCNTIRFVLDKNKKYDYTVNWEDGTTTTGSFTTPGGARVLPVCIRASSSGSGGCNNTANTFKIGGQGATVESVDCGTISEGFSIYADATNDNEIEVILPAAPSASKTYTVVNGFTTTSLQPNQAVVYAYKDQTEVDYLSTGGGTLKVSIVNGKVQVDFCNVSVKDEDGSGTTTVSGKFSCQ